MHTAEDDCPKFVLEIVLLNEQLLGDASRHRSKFSQSELIPQWNPHSDLVSAINKVKGDLVTSNRLQQCPVIG